MSHKTMFKGIEDLQAYDRLNKADLAQRLRTLADRKYPNQELGGVYHVDNNCVSILDNVAEDKSEHLTFSDNDWDWVINSINKEPLILFHTHIKDTQPAKLSWDDIYLSRILSIPVCSYHFIEKKWDFYSPNIAHPYPLRLNKRSSSRDINWFIGWEYEPGRADCFSVVEYYCQACGCTLPIIKRYTEDYGKNRVETWNRFLSEALKTGFEPVYNNRPRTGDAVLFRLNGVKFPNHIGVLIEDEGFKFIHSLGGKRTSECLDLKPYRNTIAGYYRLSSCWD